MRTASTMMLRTLTIAAALAAGLSACSPPAPTAKSEKAPTTAPAVTPGDPNQETLGKRYIDLLPQWVPIANTSDGGKVAYDLKNLLKPQAGVAEITLQITHGAPQEWTIDEATQTRKVSYTQEIAHFRYRCPSREFAVVSREIRDERDQVVAKVATPDAAFAKVDGNGVATVAFNPACAER